MPKILMEFREELLYDSGEEIRLFTLRVIRSSRNGSWTAEYLRDP